MKYQFVIQWPSDLLADYDLMIETEDQLDSRLTALHQVDGHDVGSGETNIFIHTGDPQAAFVEAREILQASGRWDGVRIAYREQQANDFSILWPATLRDFEVR